MMTTQKMLVCFKSLTLFLFYKSKELLSSKTLGNLWVWWSMPEDSVAEEISHMCTSVYLSSVVDNIVAAEIPLLIDLLERSSYQRNILLCFWQNLGLVTAIVGARLFWKKPKHFGLFERLSCLSLISLRWSAYITYQVEILIFHQVSGDELPISF